MLKLALEWAAAAPLQGRNTAWYRDGNEKLSIFELSNLKFHSPCRPKFLNLQCPMSYYKK